MVVSSLGHALTGPGEPLDLRRQQGGAAFVPPDLGGEFKDSGIRANPLIPGVVDTPMRRPGRAGAVAENHAGPLRANVRSY